MPGHASARFRSPLLILAPPPIVRITTRPATVEDRPVMEPMLAAYTRVIAALSSIPDPRRTLEDAWFEHGDLHPYVIEVDGAPVGLALVMGPLHAAAIGEACDRLVHDLYVDRRWRGRGVARAAMHTILDADPGRWALSVLESNQRAVGFWRALLAERNITPEIGPGPDGLPTFRFAVAERP